MTELNKTGLLESYQFLPRELPSRAVFEQYRPEIGWFLNEKLAVGSHHDFGHLARVLILHELILSKLQQDDPTLVVDREATRWASTTHDLRKRSEYELNFQIHGIKSSVWVKDEFATKHPTIPHETIDRISYVNYFHGFPDKKVPVPESIELQILKDADSADMLRLVYSGVLFLRRLPRKGRDVLFERIYSGAHFNATRSLLPLAEELTKRSLQREDYHLDPFSAVMETAVEMGIIKP